MATFLWPYSCYWGTFYQCLHTPQVATANCAHRQAQVKLLNCLMPLNKFACVCLHFCRSTGFNSASFSSAVIYICQFTAQHWLCSPPLQTLIQHSIIRLKSSVCECKCWGLLCVCVKLQKMGCEVQMVCDLGAGMHMHEWWCVKLYTHMYAHTRTNKISICQVWCCRMSFRALYCLVRLGHKPRKVQKHKSEARKWKTAFKERKSSFATLRPKLH